LREAQTMKRIFSTLLIAFSSFFSVHLQAAPMVFGIGGEFEMGIGWRQDQFEWNFADPSGLPAELVNVDWEDLEIALFTLRGHLRGWDHAYVRGQADWGWILQGKNNTTIFAPDETPLSIFNTLSDNGDVFDVSAGVGVNFFNWRSP